MKSHPHLLSTSEQINQLSQLLKNESVIGFDTEFIRESTFFPIVEILQIATESESWLVDAQAFKKNHSPSDPQAFDPAFKPLLEVFADPKILKIVHAAQGDQECLFTSFGQVATPVLDTAVAASLCGYGDGIGLSKLLKLVLDVTLVKGHARTNWSVRPLPAQLIEYAHADVVHLVKLGKTLLEQLDQGGRKSWAFELSSKSEDILIYQPAAEGLTQKLGRSGKLDKQGYAALLGLVKWREERVRQLNLPRRWVADDHVLVDLAHVRPKDVAHLSTFRGLNKGELRNSSEAILKAIHQNHDYLGYVPAKASKPFIPSQEESQVLDLLRCYVNILADQHQIAAKHLMTSAKFLNLLRSEINTQEDLVEQGILSSEAASLIGKELIAMIHGKRALSIQKNQIKVIESNPSNSN